MKPIKLKIKGVNSFIEDQTIDFEKLTDRGFFGIFGPTGSGKSTVLDGITLALYGELARKSSNYINTNCNEASVSFEFQISGANTKKYVVDRQFKRDNKSGNPRTSGAKLIDITEEKEVIASGVKPVTEACREIIGLSLDDFTRTVVLPQGKFSEFLKLEGKQRRDMLERLFNLQQYGDNLASKLSQAIGKERSENQFLLGQLETFEDISEEALEDKNKEYDEFKIKLDKLNDELQNILKNFEESKEVWNLQLELENYKKYQEELNERKYEIDKDSVKITLGESAQKIFPYIKSYEATIKEIEVCELQLGKLKIDIEKIKISKEEIDLKYKEINSKKDNELPKLLKKQERVESSIEEKKKLDVLIKEINEIKSKIIQVEDRIKNGEVFLKEKENTLNENNEILKISHEKYDKLKIDESFKSKINEGIILNQRYEDMTSQVNKDKLKIKELYTEAKKLSTDKDTIVNLLNEKDYTLKIDGEKLESLIKNCPGSQDTLLNLQSKLSINKDKWDKFNNLLLQIEESEKLIVSLNENIDNGIKEREKLNKELNTLKFEQEAIKIERLAKELRENLKSEEQCPVCGSVHHEIEKLKVTKSDAPDKSEEINLKEIELKTIEQDIIKNETIKKGEEETINKNSLEIQNLGDDFKNCTVEKLEDEFIKLKGSIEKYNREKEALELKIKVLREEKINLDSNLSNLNKNIERNKLQTEEYKKDLDSKTKLLNEINLNLNKIKAETKVENFIEENKKILEVEKERDAIENNIKSCRETIEKAIIDKDKAADKLNDLKASLVRGNTLLDEKEVNKVSIIESINEKVGTLENLDNLLQNVDNLIISIQDDFNKITKDKEEIERIDKAQNENYIAIVTKNNELNSRSTKEKEYIDKIIKEENFKDKDEVKLNLISKEEISLIKKKVEDYKENIAKISGAIESSLKKIDNRLVSKEQWDEVNRLKAEKEDDIKKANEEKVNLENEVKIIKIKLKELEGLVDKKKKLDEKLGILSDLERLFKGKKFVEFVATNQLKYISIEASKRLKEITGGNYGLEVNEDGKFIIRDYKNGGAQRDASTLSGGETFLTSLALALALSSQIQLKGTAPLELFFLDEGFGTLDDNLLEIVMSSLERIHNEKLKVGIISHVESIKNRVPVKLILSPAQSGKGGSKVKIERS